MNKLWKKLIALAVIVSLMVLAVVPTFAQGGVLTDIPVTGTLSDGGTFEGVLSITGFGFQNGELVVSGVLEGTATSALGVVTEITQVFTNILASLLGSGRQCRVLELDLGPLHLDLLGLVVDLDEVNLDIVAQSGPGNLLGNLLCALTGLLDTNGALSSILQLINQINNVL